MRFVEAEEEELGDGDCGVVGCDEILFRLRIGIFTDEGLYVAVRDIFKTGWVFGERAKVFEE